MNIKKKKKLRRNVIPDHRDSCYFKNFKGSSYLMDLTFSVMQKLSSSIETGRKFLKENDKLLDYHYRNERHIHTWKWLKILRLNQF